VAGALLGVTLLSAFCIAVGPRSLKKRLTRQLKKRSRRLLRLREVWFAAGMGTKLKLCIGLCQCLFAIPSTYRVGVPEGARHLLRPVELVRQPDRTVSNPAKPIYFASLYRLKFI
jgi:hypothetical protein